MSEGERARTLLNRRSPAPSGSTSGGFAALLESPVLPRWDGTPSVVEEVCVPISSSSLYRTMFLTAVKSRLPLTSHVLIKAATRRNKDAVSGKENQNDG